MKNPSLVDATDLFGGLTPRPNQKIAVIDFAKMKAYSESGVQLLTLERKDGQWLYKINGDVKFKQSVEAVSIAIEAKYTKWLADQVV